MSHCDIHFDWTLGANGAWFGDMRNAPKKVIQPTSQAEIVVQIERLSRSSLKNIRAAWAAEFRGDPPRTLWRDLLLRMLAWRLQEKVFGGHDKATLRLLRAYGQKRTGDGRCRRLKTGTVLVREFRGTRHTVTIVPDGFIWQEKTYPSLSAIARIITGTNWNGPKFFGLREGGGTKDSKQLESVA